LIDNSTADFYKHTVAGLDRAKLIQVV